MKLKTIIGTILALSVISTSCGKNNENQKVVKVKNDIEKKIKNIQTMDLENPSLAVSAAAIIVEQRNILPTSIANLKAEHSDKVTDATNKVTHLRSRITSDESLVDMEGEIVRAERELTAARKRQEELLVKAKDTNENRKLMLNSSILDPNQIDDFKNDWIKATMNIQDQKFLADDQVRQAELQKSQVNSKYSELIFQNKDTTPELQKAVADLETITANGSAKMAKFEAKVAADLAQLEQADQKLQSIYELNADMISSMTPDLLEGLEIVK